MAFNNEISVIAGGTIPPCRFVYGDTSADEQVLVATGATLSIVGVSPEWQRGAPGLAGSDNAIVATTGQTFKMVGMGNDCLLTCGAAVTRWDLLTSDGTGRGVTAVTGNKYGAIALQSGTGAGTKIRVLVCFGTM